MPDPHLIAIEGLPGSGHDEFAQWAGTQPDWYAEAEDGAVALPPIERGALSHVLQRLVRRYECHQSLLDADLFRHRVVMDFAYETHALWAECLLNDNEWAIYQKIAEVITPPKLGMDLVVYFDAPEATIMSALRHRHKRVDTECWTALYQAYQRHFFAYEETPLLVVRAQSANHFDGIGSREALWDKILSYPGGKTYFMGESGLWDGGRPADD
jgi:hypothetical protein